MLTKKRASADVGFIFIAYLFRRMITSIRVNELMDFLESFSLYILISKIRLFFVLFDSTQTLPYQNNKLAKLPITSVCPPFSTSMFLKTSLRYYSLLRISQPLQFCIDTLWLALQHYVVLSLLHK